MLLEITKFVCAPYRHEFEAPGLPSGSYGIFLLRSATGAMAALNPFEILEFNEVDSIVKRCRPRLKSRVEIAMVQTVTGIICDPAPDGSLFSLDILAVCPVCASIKMAEDQPLNRYVTLDVPSVICHRWQSLNVAERERAVRDAIEAFERHNGVTAAPSPSLWPSGQRLSAFSERS